MKKVVIVGAVLAVLFILICGFGGYSLLRELQGAAKSLGPEFSRAERNKIPLDRQEMRPETSVLPNENAALLYKRAFEEWVQLRPAITDERWESYVSGRAGSDSGQIEEILQPAINLVSEGADLDKVAWLIDRSDRAFGSYPVFPGLVESAQALMRQRMLGDSPLLDGYSEIAAVGIKVSDDIAQSRDPGSLRAMASIRMSSLLVLSDGLHQSWYGDRLRGERYEEVLRTWEKFEMIDPLPVWRITAYLQLDTWESYDELSDDQQKLFAGARRDDGILIDASTAEILKFWNKAIEAAEGKDPLEQYLQLGDLVLNLRARTDLGSFPLKQLWTLDSATKGAGSIDWLLANEQLMLTLQVLDILSTAGDELPARFDCKRVSLIGEKAYTYERTETGFKISAKPSNRLSPSSLLAQQSLVYEFKEPR